ncbi:MAG: dimethyl sulfoxide reductase anchor subunit family protein [Chloroflexota bacterium]
MESREDNRALVAFTWLAPLSIGGFTGLLIVRGPAAEDGPDAGATALLALALLALAASLLHLGRPFRAYRALLHFSTSWLSREVILFGLFLPCLAAYALPLAPLGQSARSALGALAAILGFLSLVATGKVYSLPSRPCWNHWAATASCPVGALSSGLLLGIFAAQLSMPDVQLANAGIATLTWIAAVALATAPVLTLLRSTRGDTAEGRATWQIAQGPYQWALALRITGALGGLVLLLAGGWAAVLAWVPAALGELADRILFFHAVVPISFTARSGVPEMHTD